MIESGMDTAMMMVERQLPKNKKIMTLVSAAAIKPSMATPCMAARTNKDWSLMGLTVSASGSEGLIALSFSSTPSTMAYVDVVPFFRTDINTERLPCTWTILV